MTSFISPFRAERDMARALFEPDDFMEVFIDAPLDVAESRDPKGLYKKARSGELPNFTGIDSAYEAPVNPELVLKTDESGIAEAADKLVDSIRKNINEVNTENSFIFNSVSDTVDNKSSLWQHFSGIEIETSKHFFDEKIFNLMDFDCDQKNSVHFFIHYPSQKQRHL